MKTLKLSKPVQAFQFEAETVVGDNGEGTTTAPVTLTVLTGDPVSHPYWEDPIVFDLSGVQHKSRIALDWCHSDYEVVGFANKFEVGENLVLSGALVSCDDDDWAAKIMKQSRAGIPFEASIAFMPSRPGDIVAQQLQAGETAECNGRTVNGPLTIFRKWPLRRAAICPSGVDRETDAQVMGAKNTGTVNVEMQIMDEPTKEKTELAAIVPPVVEPPAAAPVEPVHIVQAPDPRKEFAGFCQSFGDEKATKYFKAGLSMDDAHKAFAEDLAKENAELKAQLAAKPTAPHNAAPFDQDHGPEKKLAWSDDQIKRHCKATGQNPEKLKAALLKSAK